MKKLLTFLMFFLLAAVAAQAEDATMTAGTNGSTATVNEKSAIKVGTSKAGGDMTITVPAGATSLEFYAAAWNGVSGLSLNITPEANVSPKSVSLTADTGISGNGPFTLSGTESTYKFTIALSNITAETIFTLTSSAAKRFVVWGATYTPGGGTTQSYALTFANNSQGTFSAKVGGQTVSSGSKVAEGETVTITANPAQGYAFNAWNVYTTANQYNYVTVSENNTFTMPSEAVTVDAYFIEETTVTAPTFSPDGGTYTSAQNVTISAPGAAYIYYTFGDDDVQNMAGTEYEGDQTIVTISKSCTLKAAAVYDDENMSVSDVKTATYVINIPVPAPTFSVAAGTYTEDQNVKISNYNNDYIYAYTTDGSAPTFSGLDVTNGTEYDKNEGITISSSCTLKAIAVDEDGNASSITSATYTIVKPLTTIAQLKQNTTTTETEFILSLTDAVVTYVYNSENNGYAYLQDASGAVLVYQKEHGLSVGQKINGLVSVKAKTYYQMPEITDIDYTKATVSDGGTIPDALTSIEDFTLDNLGKKFVLTGAKVTVANSDSQATGKVKVGNAEYSIFNQLKNVTTIVGSKVNVTGYISQYNSGIQLAVYEQSQIETVPVVVTAISNNESYGTVSVVNNVVTATPAEGHRVSKTTPYEVVEGVATVTQSENIFTVGAEDDCTVKINFEAIPSYTIKWYANGEKLTEQPNLYEGDTADEPEDDGYKSVNNKVFTGWVTTARVSSTEQPTYVTDFTVTRDITYYAVYATQSGEESITRVTDVLNSGTIGVEETSYNNWSEISGESAAIYAGNSARNGSSYETYAIQLKSRDAVSGIVTTASGGKVKKIEVEWASTTTNGRALQVYAKNTAYESAVDLYSEGDKGSLKGTIEKGNTTSFTFDDNDDYAYFGIRSASGALYLKSISITWETGGATYSNFTTTPEDPTETMYVKVERGGASSVKLKDVVLDWEEMTQGGNGVYGTTEKTTVKAGDRVYFKKEDASGTTKYFIPAAPFDQQKEDGTTVTIDPSKLNINYSSKAVEIQESEFNTEQDFFTFNNGTEPSYKVNFYVYKVNNEWHVGASIKEDVVTEVNDINVADKGVKAYKVIENGQVVIVRGDQRFNIMGQPIR